MKRPLIIAMSLLATVALTAGCAGRHTGRPASTPTPSTAISPSPSPSPSVDIAANREAVCAKASAELTPEKGQVWGLALGKIIGYRMTDNTAALAVAEKDATAAAEAWGTRFDALAVESADPALKAALGTTAANFRLFGTPVYLAKFSKLDDALLFATDLTDAVADLAKVCG